MDDIEAKKSQLKRAQRLIDLYNHALKQDLKENAGAIMGVIATAIYNGDFDIGSNSEYRVGWKEGEPMFNDIIYLKKE